jgi:hypothetical protein
VEHKYIFVPRDELTTANSDKFILLHWLKNKDQDLGFSLEQIPMVYVPVNPRDLI